ncbi:MAG: SDR family NAD(P)-dependent oxidoreductase [Eubacteriales bacterium]|nr:SDR family NAD(P)-dependent oxidoreductase [Eubacteriales bacterium]
MGFELPDELIFMKNKKAEQKKSDASMAGKVCVITGATSGVGLEALKKLAEGKADIVMVCRNLEKAKLIKEDIQKKWPVNIDLFEADFSILSDVRRAAGEILAKYKQIHVLINSAGLHSTTKVMTREGFEMVFCVNHLASFLFTRLLMDRLKESAPARIIQVNSEGHRFNGLDINDLNWNKRFYTGLRGYGASKTAQLLTVWEVADELKGSGVTINALHPGDVRTNIGSNNGWLYRCFLHNVTWHSLKEPSISGEAIYYLAADPDMLDVSGKFFHLTIEEKPAKHALDRELGKKVYDLSMRMTGL